MKRISKRALRFQFDLIDEAQVHVDSLAHKRAQVSIDGVTCTLFFKPESRPEITRPEGVKVSVAKCPMPCNDGLFKRGTKPDEEPILFPLRRHKERHPPLDLVDDQLEASSRYDEFERHHPVGSLVVGKVIRQNNSGTLVRLENGLRAHLKAGYCLDHVPYQKVRWLPLPMVGETVEVIVRRHNQRDKSVLVSMHSYRFDTRYCAFAAGYRNAFDVQGSDFASLPWDK